MGGGIAPNEDTKTVVVLGAAYGGARTAQILAAGLPEGWKIILIDRNSHANHVYVMPRFAVLPGHEYKAFIPYNNVFLLDPPKPEHIHLQAQVTSIRPTHVTISRPFPELGIPTTTIAFDYAVYALGAHLPPPLNLWGTPNFKPSEEVLNNAAIYEGSKTEACLWLKEKQKIIEQAPTVLVVGGGALGIQFATDIKSVYPGKKVALLHSRLRLLPRFDEKMHEEIERSCVNMDIELILGERLDLESIENGSTKVNQLGQKVVRTVTGREIAADLLLLCTGQAPNTGLLNTMDPRTVNESTGLARVLRTMQLCSALGTTSSEPFPLTEALEKLSVQEEAVIQEELEDPTAYPHIFAIGDAADAFGAIPAGYNADAQGGVAARNIVRLIKNRAAKSSPKGLAWEALEHYDPGPPAIKVSLGLKRSVYQTGPTVGLKTDGVPDLRAASMWPFFGTKVTKDEDMIP